MANKYIIIMSFYVFFSDLQSLKERLLLVLGRQPQAALVTLPGGVRLQRRNGQHRHPPASAQYNDSESQLTAPNNHKHSV